jgi:hypothetical protein
LAAVNATGGEASAGVSLMKRGLRASSVRSREPRGKC